MAKIKSIKCLKFYHNGDIVIRCKRPKGYRLISSDQHNAHITILLSKKR